jgi:Asp-tRNA(Asn)/Glu-tRNA(Gln) amidotransferase B subunit
VRPFGESKLGTRCEIKNLNSFRFLQQAIEYEVRRQTELIEDGGKVVQETRLYDPDRNETRPMRSKEDAQDYRYFPDPDLPPLVIDDAWIERIRAELPELPMMRRLRFIASSREDLIEIVKSQSTIAQQDIGDETYEETLPELQRSAILPTYGLSMPDATALVSSRATADYFENTVAGRRRRQDRRQLDPRRNLRGDASRRNRHRSGADRAADARGAPRSNQGRHDLRQDRKDGGSTRCGRARAMPMRSSPIAGSRRSRTPGEDRADRATT